MKVVTNDFKQALKHLKEVNTIITYIDGTETVTLNSDDIINSTISWDTEICKSCCKMLDLETKIAIPKGSRLHVQIGIKVNNSFEYVDYGYFYTIEKSKYQLNSETYLTTAYDAMIKLNIKASENPITSPSSGTIADFIYAVLDKCGINYNFDWDWTDNHYYPFYRQETINMMMYENNKDTTYRDIMDDIAECLGTNFLINENDELVAKDFNLVSQLTLDGDVLKSVNVAVGEEKQGITGIEEYDGTTLLTNFGTNTSVYRIKDNNLITAWGGGVFTNILDFIEGVSYRTFSIDTYGILILEPFDYFTINYKNENYLVLNLRAEIKNGTDLSETINYDFQEDDVSTYTTSTTGVRTDEIVNSAKKQLFLKSRENGQIVKCAFGEHPDYVSDDDALLSNNDYLYWKEKGYGDQFAIVPAFSGTDDSNLLKIQGAVGAAGTLPNLYDLARISGKSGHVWLKGMLQKPSGGSWIKGRENAVVRNNNATQGGAFYVLASQKTANGEWSIGQLSGEDRLSFSYGTDANYNSNTNSTTRCWLNAGLEGAIGTIESGGNNNGYYTKYSDGTLICRGFAGPVTTNGNSGSSKTITFPYNFVDTNWCCSVTKTGGGSYWSWVVETVTDKSKTGFKITTWNNNQYQAPNLYYDWVVIGRWK